MQRRNVILAAVVGATGLCAAAAMADPPAPAPDVTVAVGAALQAKRAEIGERDIEDLRQDLKDTVIRALVRHQGGVFHATRVALILEDAKANRPTFAELSRRPDLSMRSLSLGGAKISGQVTGADGQMRPLSVSYYTTDLRDVIAAATWSDAYIAFDRVGDAVVSGRLDQR